MHYICIYQPQNESLMTSAAGWSCPSSTIMRLVLVWAERPLTKEATSPLYTGALHMKKWLHDETSQPHQLEDEAWVKMDNPTIRFKENNVSEDPGVSPPTPVLSEGHGFSRRRSEGTVIVLVCFLFFLEGGKKWWRRSDANIWYDTLWLDRLWGHETCGHMAVFQEERLMFKYVHIFKKEEQWLL